MLNFVPSNTNAPEGRWLSFLGKIVPE